MKGYYRSDFEIGSMKNQVWIEDKQVLSQNKVVKTEKDYDEEKVWGHNF